jgi:hypothetical protein
VERIRFGDEQFLTVPGHGAAVEEHDGRIYMAIGLRNGGSGLAVLHAWRARQRESITPGTGASEQMPDLSDFRRQQLDLYIPAGDTGYWQGAMRDPDEAGYDEVLAAVRADRGLTVDLLYGDYEGGQRAVVRLMITLWPGDDGDDRTAGRRASVLRYWNLDRDDPR